jgi:xylulokinase
MHMTDVLLGVDIGTGSSKAVLTTADGHILATATRPHPHSLSMPRPGWAEVDADRVWWQDLVSLCRELATRAGEHRIAALCVSGVGPCLLLCDDADRPVRPAILYGIDMRASDEIEELTRRYGADEILARGGTALSSQAVGPKALWVRRHEPDAWSRAAGWYNSNSFLVKRLTGEYVLDHHTASQCDPLYDIDAADWYQPWYADVMDRLPAPRLAWPSDVVGRVTAQAATATLLPEGTPVCTGTVDAWAEAFSAGVRNTGDLMLMYGSTMFFVHVVKDIARHPRLWTTAAFEPGVHTRAAGMSTSGLLTSWVQDLTGGASFADLVHEAEQVPAGSNGLLLLPYFADGPPSSIPAPAASSPVSRCAILAATFSAPSTRASPSASARSLSCWTPTRRQSTASSPLAAAPRVASGHRSSATSPAASRRYPNRPSGLATATP